MNANLTAPWKCLFKVILIFVFLLMMKNLILNSTPTPTARRVEPADTYLYLESPPRLWPDSKVLLHSASTESEKKLIEGRFGEQHLYVEYQHTWPEYFGYVLAAGFALGCFWFFFSLVSEDWTKERAQHVSRGKLAVFASLHFSYAIGACLGWVWMSALPFFLMGACLVVFAMILHHLPVTSSKSWRFTTPSNKAKLLEVEIAGPPKPGKKLKVNPLIRKMFELRTKPAGGNEKVSIDDALNMLASQRKEDEDFENCFQGWLTETKKVKEWEHKVVFERHGMYTVRCVAQSLFDGSELRGGTWFLLEALTQLHGNPEQLVSSVHQRVERWESGE